MIFPLFERSHYRVGVFACNSVLELPIQPTHMLPMLRVCMLNTRCFFFFLTSLLLAPLFVCSALAAAEDTDPWIILTPRPDTLIQDGALFVVVNIDESLALDPASTTFYLDGKNLTPQAKVSESGIRFLYTDPLRNGRHEVFISAKNKRGEQLPDLHWSFYTGEKPVLPVTQAGPLTRPRSRPAITGQTYIDTRTASFSGRRSLRQMPEQVFTASVNAEGRYGAFTFPLRLFVTSDQTSSAQPRNRFLFGVRSSYLTVLAGDNAPLFNPTMLNGARVRGGLVELKLKPVYLTVLGGNVRDRVNPTPVLDGTFARNLYAARLSFGSTQSVLFSLTGMKARDDATSIQFRPGTATPMENVVVGSDLDIRFKGGKYRLESGASMSITTQDISRGVATKAEVDSLFETDIPFDPASVSWLITLNGTTVPLTLQERSSLAWYVRGRASAIGHTLSAHMTSVGSTFFSFGNPFLINDRSSFTIADRFRILGGKLSGTLRFQHYGTPPGKNILLSTLSANTFSGQLIVSPWRSPTWLMIGYRGHNRTSTPDGTDALLTDSKVTTFSMGGYHLFYTGEYQHGINLFVTQANRKDQVRPTFDNTTRTFSLSLNEQFPSPLYFNLHLNYLTVTSANMGTWQKLTTLGGKVGYRMMENRLDLAATIRNAHTAESSLLPRSNRVYAIINGTYQFMQNMSFEVQLGYTAYREANNTNNQWTEPFLVFRHRYIF